MSPSRAGFLISVLLHAVVAGSLLFFWLRPAPASKIPLDDTVPLNLAMFAPESESVPEPGPATTHESVPEPVIASAPPEPLPKTAEPTSPEPKSEPRLGLQPEPRSEPRPEPAPKSVSKSGQAERPAVHRPKATVKPLPETGTESSAPTRVEPTRPSAALAPAPHPAPENPAPDADKMAEQQRQLLAAYQSALAAAIEREKFYPPLARRLNQEGIVEVGFTVLADGSITHVHALNQSPSAVLERGALEAIERVGKFKPIPPELAKSSMDLTISLVYKLR